jgi:hypothetical protein
VAADVAELERKQANPLLHDDFGRTVLSWGVGTCHY